MSNLYFDNKTIVLLPPDDQLLKQIRRKNGFKKIVWHRKHKFDNVIALGEWNEIKLLRFLFLVPLIAFAIISFIIFLIVFGSYYFINKARFGHFSDKYLAMLNFLSKDSKRDYWSTAQKDADEIICNEAQKQHYYILYLHKSEEKILKEIDKDIVGNHIDQIWIYNHSAEIIERIIKENYQNPQSKIIDFDVISKKSRWDIKDRKTTVRQVDFIWLQNINLDKTLFSMSALKTDEGKIYNPQVPSPRMILNPNDFLNNQIVFYYEPSYNEKINQYLSTNYTAINEKLAEKGMRFLYFPRTIFENQSFADLIEYVDYKFPHLLSGDEQTKELQLQGIFSSTDLQDFYSNIAVVLGIPEMTSPCFFHSVERETEMTFERTYQYSIHHLTNSELYALENEVNHYIELVSIPTNKIYFSLSTSNPNDKDDPDDIFYVSEKKISEELNGFIQNLNLVKDERLIIDSLVFLIKKLNKTQPDLCANLNKTLFEKINNAASEVSRLHIDEQYRIVLLDYNNLEISMTPLQKTLYIFFLKNKDGVRLKELSSHRDELMDIYGRVGNRLDMNQVKKSIIDLTDATSNSINEKCSKIKEAFLSKMDEQVAQHYYIMLLPKIRTGT